MVSIGEPVQGRVRALFVHHSIGRGLLDDGLLRERLTLVRPDIDLWDHDYNEIGFSDPFGHRTGTALPIPGDDTDPAGLVELLRATAAGEFPDIANLDILILKSCFPNSNVTSDEDLGARQELYRRLKAHATQLSTTVYLVSSPPLVVESSTPAARSRALTLNEWLKDYWPGEKTQVVDLFGTLAYQQGPFRGALHHRFRALRPRDSHLRAAGSVAGAEVIVDALAGAGSGSPRAGDASQVNT